MPSSAKRLLSGNQVSHVGYSKSNFQLVYMNIKYVYIYIIGFLLIRSESSGLYVPDDSAGFSRMYLPSLEEEN